MQQWSGRDGKQKTGAHARRVGKRPPLLIIRHLDPARSDSCSARTEQTSVMCGSSGQTVPSQRGSFRLELRFSRLIYKRGLNDKIRQLKTRVNAHLCSHGVPDAPSQCHVYEVSLEKCPTTLSITVFRTPSLDILKRPWRLCLPTPIRFQKPCPKSGW